MRRILASAAVALLLVSAAPAPAAAAEGTYRLQVNWVEPAGEARPFWYDGNAMLPLRATFEAMGYQVAYDQEEQRADLTSPFFPAMTVWSGRPVVHMNGTDLPLKAPVSEREGRMFISSDVLDPLQFSRQWDDQQQTLQVVWHLPEEVNRRLLLGVQEAYWRLKSFGIIKDSPTS